MNDRVQDANGLPENRRKAVRSSVMQRCQIRFGSSAIDCLIVDTSAGGLRTRTGSVVVVPEWVTLKFTDGSVSRARQRWARGTEIGFELVVDGGNLLDSMIAGLTHDQRHALITRIEASLLTDNAGAAD